MGLISCSITSSLTLDKFCYLLLIIKQDCIKIFMSIGHSPTLFYYVILKKECSLYYVEMMITFMCHYCWQMWPSCRGWESTVTVFWGRGQFSERKQTQKGAVVDQRFVLIPVTLVFDQPQKFLNTGVQGCSVQNRQIFSFTVTFGSLPFATSYSQGKCYTARLWCKGRVLGSLPISQSGHYSIMCKEEKHKEKVSFWGEFIVLFSLPKWIFLGSTVSICRVYILLRKMDISFQIGLLWKTNS